MDAIKMLKEDHRRVEQLFAEFEKLGPRAQKSKQRIVEQIIQELTIHAELEETIFYPAYQKQASDEELVYEALEEHHVAKFVLRELQAIDLEHPRHHARVMVLKEVVEHHVQEEEQEMFVQARKALGAERLKQLGEEIAEVKQRLLGTSSRVTIEKRQAPLEVEKRTKPKVG